MQNGTLSAKGSPAAPEELIDAKTRLFILAAALLALFLGALDALVMAAAMPSLVADLGGLHLYSWVYSVYLLSRAVALPVFGKLADLYKTKTLFVISIGIFVLSSITAGLSTTMLHLIVSRVFQGIGAGGNFALVYIVLADVSAPENRGRTLAMGSVVWGISSVLGPTLGGFIVSYFSWRWIFFINVPLGALSLAGIVLFLMEIRPKKSRISIDFAGITLLTVAILSLLSAFLFGGRDYAWTSPQIIGLLVLAAASSVAFYRVEKRAADPILAMAFFADRGFSAGNGAVFLSSFAIFALFAYAPLFVQGALGENPMQVGMAMLALSLGWSLGSLTLGHIVHRFGQKPAAASRALMLIAGSVWTLVFSTTTSMVECFLVFSLAGLGMGFVTLSTLMAVQNSLDITDLGVATASHQFARTLGGTIGVGVCGGFLTTRLSKEMNSVLDATAPGQLDPAIARRIGENIENVFQSELLGQLPPDILHLLQEAVAAGVSPVFWTVSAASVACLLVCLLLPPKDADHGKPSHL